MKYKLTNNNGVTTIELSGNLNEGSEEPLLALRGEPLENEIAFDWARVGYINSYGIARWLSFIESLKGQAKLSFYRCSESFVEYASMLPLFTGGGVIKSLAISFLCEECGKDSIVLLECDFVAPGDDVAVAKCAFCAGRAVAQIDAAALATALGSTSQ